jgi:hypothetical protein
MTTFNIPPFNPRLTANPQPDNPGLGPQLDGIPAPLAVTASKKVDDLSRHESKHDTDPKHAPKHNAREKGTVPGKPDSYQPQGGQPRPENTKQ